MQRMFTITALVLVGISGVFAQIVGDPLAFPATYRTWTHTHTNIVDDPKDPFYGFHNVYVNPTGARVSLAGTGAYPDGSKFVVAFYSVERNGTLITQGKPLAVALMSKDRAKFAETGGWGYAFFGPDGTPKTINQTKDCFGCHESKKANDYIFSTYVK